VPAFRHRQRRLGKERRRAVRHSRPQSDVLRALSRNFREALRFASCAGDARILAAVHERLNGHASLHVSRAPLMTTARERLPSGWGIVALVPVGRPDQAPAAPGRKSVDKVVWWL